MSKQKKRDISVHWFRHGLRIHDNPALLEALRNCSKLYPIFIFDGEMAGTKETGYHRMRFLHECLEDLDNQFKRLGGRLYSFTGDPVVTLTKLFQEWGVTKLTFEQDPEPVWQKRDIAVKALCQENGVQCIERISHTLWNPSQIIKENGGIPPHTYALFKQVVNLIGKPDRPVEFPEFKTQDGSVFSDTFDGIYELPSFKQLNYEPEYIEQLNPVNKWTGGETKALQLLKDRIVVEEKASQAGHVMPNQRHPDLIGPPKSMSPHLRFGCLSVRKFYWRLCDTYSKVCCEMPDSATAQLIWREYFYAMSFNNIKYNKMKENPICIQINWYKNEERLECWKMGKTGFPWIDACMNQLRLEGWLHHVGRNAVACFLTRGYLWLSWEDGLKVFDKYLLDADWSVNAGNWMWVSSSAFENCLQCPVCFSPIYYGMRMDPTGEYIRRYIPQLKDMPLKYLFYPWKAPLEIQQKAGCIVGKDYPLPIVDYKESAKKCKHLMEEVKAVGKSPAFHCAPSNQEEVRQFFWLPNDKYKETYVSNFDCQVCDEHTHDC